MYFNSRSNSNISLRKKQLLILYIVKAHIFINYRQVFHLRKEHIKGSVHEKLEFLPKSLLVEDKEIIGKYTELLRKYTLRD